MPKMPTAVATLFFCATCNPAQLHISDSLRESCPLTDWVDLLIEGASKGKAFVSYSRVTLRMKLGEWLPTSASFRRWSAI